jgi:hypothetical protein
MARLFRLAPLCDTPDDALDWFEAQGAIGTAVLFRGPDGMVRGAAEIKAQHAPDRPAEDGTSCSEPARAGREVR